MRGLKVIVIVAVLAVLLFSAPAVVVRVKAGGIVGPDARAGSDGNVSVAPVELARLAGVDLEVYALARMLASETGSWSREKKIPHAWVAVNDARRLKRSLLLTITASADSSKVGRFGRQQGRRYGSSVPPRELDIDVALAVLGGSVPDPTGGAVKFLHPAAFGKQEGTASSADATIAKWVASGLEVVKLAEVPEALFFRPRRGALVS